MGAHSNLGVFEDSSVTTAGIVAARESTNQIDMAVVKPQLGVGQHAPYLVIEVAAAPTAATDTLSIELQVDADDGAGSPVGSWKTILMVLCDATGAEVLASDARLAVAGTRIITVPLPFEVDEQWVRLYYNNTVSAGKFLIDAWLEDGPNSTFRGSQVLFSDVGQP